MERKSGALCVPAGRGLQSGTRQLVAPRRNFTTLGGKVTQSPSLPPVTSTRASAPPFTRQAHKRLAAFCGRVCHSAGRWAARLIWFLIRGDSSANGLSRGRINLIWLVLISRTRLVPSYSPPANKQAANWEPALSQALTWHTCWGRAMETCGDRWGASGKKINHL